MLDTSGLKVAALQVGVIGPVSFQIDRAECVALSGQSGSGKTRLLRALADLDPHHGDIRLDGEDCNAMAAVRWRRRVGLLPADSVWWFERVGEHFGELPAQLLGDLGFEDDVMGWSVTRLSSGERQRLALARLLARRPQALLLDEPSANLDPANSERVEQVVTAYREQRGAPVLWVSHDAAQRARVAQRELYLGADGRVEPRG